MSQSGREVRMFRRNLRPASSEHPVHYAPSTRVSQSGTVVRMLKRNLRLNHQNTLYIMLQALACLSLVEWYECWRGICAWIIKTPCILCYKHSRVSVWYRSTNVSEKSSTCFVGTPHTLYPAHSRVSDWHAKISCLLTHWNNNTVSCTDQYSRSVSLHDAAEKQMLSQNGRASLWK